MSGSKFLVRFALLLSLVAYSVAPLVSGTGGDGALFLIIDEDSIDNGNPPNFFSDQDVNDDLSDLALRHPLRFFDARIGDTITLHTGQVGDEGWFAVKTIPESWTSTGPTADGLRNFLGNPSAPYPHNVGWGLGTGDDPEVLLDKIPFVTPLRATGLAMLVGRRICAVVYDSDVSINYDPLEGSLKGENLGTVALEVLDVRRLFGFSSSSLPEVDVEILDAADVCESELDLFLDAPEPFSSSEPFDIDPPAELSIADEGVVNGASFGDDDDTQAPAPGSIVSIFGAGFASQEWAAQSVPLPASLGGVEVTFDGVPARLLFVAPGQINAQVPWGLLSGKENAGQATVVVTRNGKSGPPQLAPVQRVSPAIFTFEFGSGPAVAINPDNTLAQSAGAVPGVPSHPAQRGSWIAILATGLGPLVDTVADGANSMDLLRRTQTTPKVWIGGQQAAVSFSGLSPQFVGVYQVNVNLQNALTPGQQLPLRIEIEGVTSRADATIALE